MTVQKFNHYMRIYSYAIFCIAAIIFLLSPQTKTLFGYQFYTQPASDHSGFYEVYITKKTAFADLVADEIICYQKNDRIYQSQISQKFLANYDIHLTNGSYITKSQVLGRTVLTFDISAQFIAYRYSIILILLIPMLLLMYYYVKHHPKLTSDE